MAKDKPGKKTYPSELARDILRDIAKRLPK